MGDMQAERLHDRFFGEYGRDLGRRTEQSSFADQLVQLVQYLTDCSFSPFNSTGRNHLFIIVTVKNIQYPVGRLIQHMNGPAVHIQQHKLAVHCKFMDIHQKTPSTKANPRRHITRGAKIIRLSLCRSYFWQT